MRRTDSPGRSGSRLAVGATLWVWVGAIALAAGSASADFSYAVYDGSWDLLPDFESLSPVATGQSPTIGLGVTSETDTFGLVFTNVSSSRTPSSLPRKAITSSSRTPTTARDSTSMASSSSTTTGSTGRER